MMSISVIGECFGFLLFAFSATESFHQPYLGFLGFTIASVFTSFYQPASQAMIADVVAAEHRSHVYAVFYMMINVAVVIGPIIGSVVFYNYPVVTLVAIALADLLLLVLLQKFGHETAPLVLHPEGKIKKRCGKLCGSKSVNIRSFSKIKCFYYLS
ncbi:multidrug resistance protein [Listeria grayi]|uniref:Multidrug resistance protein n=1 Tax=Listeria grayi TaxID=1641 RepID=A0A378MB02_LISGR|nr:multidrug resistance protein [Listeria grayi]